MTFDTVERAIAAVAAGDFVVGGTATGFAVGSVGILMYSVMETSAAAPPPTPLKMATSCGMAVIFTKREVGMPMAAPTTMATTTRAI